ncbi:hypothetical protein V1264_002351 [Littorina saxatilis]|uniref:Uncharacterized protein n=1 Tax=Littorina saxatilis TaxID=31220 RepID=A0AAN9GS15_9CAEN
MLFLLNSTLLHYRDIAPKRTRSRRRNRSHSKIVQGLSPSGRKISFRGCTARAASELEKTDPRHISEQQGHQDSKTKEGGVSQVRRHQAMTSTPQGIIEFQGTGRKRRSRTEKGDEKPLHVSGHYDEIDCMTIVVRSDVRQVKVTPRQDGGLRAVSSAGARLRKAWKKERDVREAENDEEEFEEEDEKFDDEEDQTDEDGDGVEFEPERSRAAGKENGSHQLRVSFRSELRIPPTPDDGEGGRHSDHECDVDWQQMAEGRRITPIKRRLGGGKMGGSSPTPFRLLGVPPSYHDGAKFEDLSVGNQFLCILRKLPFLSDIVRDPRDPAPLAYVCDVPTLIRDDFTRRLLEIAPTRRDERDLKRKLSELYPDVDDYDSEQDPDYQPDEPDTTDPLEYTEAEAAGVSDEDEDDVIYCGDVTHIINAEDETDTTESQDYERGNEDSSDHWEDLDTEVTLD